MKSFTDISHFPPQTHGISRQKEPLLTPDPLPPLHLGVENHMTPISIQSPLITNHPILSAIHNLPEIIRTLTRTLRKVSLKRSCCVIPSVWSTLLRVMFSDHSPFKFSSIVSFCLKITYLTISLVLITILDFALVCLTASQFSKTACTQLCASYLTIRRRKILC